jgi:hypothetical protein
MYEKPHNLDLFNLVKITYKFKCSCIIVSEGRHGLMIQVNENEQQDIYGNIYVYTHSFLDEKR